MTVTNQSLKDDALLKTIRYGPMTFDSFLEHRVEAYPERTEQLKYLLDEFKMNNYYLYMIVEFEKYYLSDKDTVTLERQFMIINQIPQRVKDIKALTKFGAAAVSNEGCTTRSATPVYLTPVGVSHEAYAKEMTKKNKILKDKYPYWECNKFGKSLTETIINDEGNIQNVFEDRKDLADINDRIESKNTGSKFKLFKISNNAMSYMKKTSNTNDDNSESDNNSKGGFKMGGYLPPGMKRKIERPKNPDTLYSIVIKNVPQYIDPRDAEKQLRGMFNEYGDIHKIKVLRTYDDKVNKNKGIAFIDFYDEESKNRAISDRGSKIIDHMVIGVEEKKDFK